MSDEEDAAAAFQPFLERFMAEVPAGAEGDRAIRGRIDTPFMDVTAGDVRLDDLSDDQLDGWFAYAKWQLWELIANRSTEGESGLIPRQEYETCSFVQQWETYPDAMRAVTAEIGVDGVIDLGRVCRREVGTKMNITRHWSCCMTPLLGRGIAVKLGLLDPHERREDVETIVQFARRLQFGTWGEGSGFVSGRGFVSPTLDDDVLQPLLAAAEPLTDPDLRKAFRRFNGTTELFGFLLHYDCRAGMADTGPYPLPSGDGFAIVRDHFLNETAYPWAAGVADGLPYAVTEVLVFRPDREIAVTVNDISTTFTQPTDYLRHLDSIAVFARDEPTTPMSDLRPLDADAMSEIAKVCSAGMLALYTTIAERDRDRKIEDGVMVYTHDLFRPMALGAGIWDRLLADGFDDLRPLTKQAWPTLTTGAAAEVLPPVFLLGEGFPAVHA